MSSPSPLERGHEAYARRDWDEVYASLSAAGRAAALAGDDLERLAVAAYLTGRADQFLSAFERAHRIALDGGDVPRAARCAFWIALELALRGEVGPASGWLTRAQRMMEGVNRACVEEGYLLVLPAEQRLHSGDAEAAYDLATQAIAIGDQFHEPDLIAAARHLAGRALLHQGRIEQGLALLDEAMVAVTAGDLSPVMTGLIYCSVIESCQRVYALGRAREWTAALARWCDAQDQLVAFTNTCRVHRAEVLRINGAWHAALEEAERACARYADGVDARPPAAALYQRAEVHRLRGELQDAERAYRDASQWGFEPQPGLALLRLAEGRVGAAAAQIRPAATATTGALPRTRILPALVEIMIAAGDVAQAGAAASELEATARTFDTGPLRAMAAEAQGRVELAAGNAETAIGTLRRAWHEWQKVEAPYAAARVRELIGLARRQVGDHDGCTLELEAARRVYRELGAAPDLARLDKGAERPSATDGGLTRRELQVLRLVAAGKTNRVVAGELDISDKTVARHVSNIFTKLGLSSRAAATAYAYEHDLV